MTIVLLILLLIYFAAVSAPLSIRLIGSSLMRGSDDQLLPVRAAHPQRRRRH